MAIFHSYVSLQKGEEINMTTVSWPSIPLHSWVHDKFGTGFRGKNIGNH